jgi:hypothetical protein
MKRICVFCGSSEGDDPRYLEAARQLGAQLAGRGTTLVYGGSSLGIMGAVADAVLQHGGQALGVIPEALAGKEIAHGGLTELFVVESMHARKAMMEDRSDGFIALPGGLGTLEELCEILTWAQLGIHHKPIGLLDVAGYYSAFIDFLDHAVAHDFVSEEHRELLMVETEPDELLNRFATFTPGDRARWLDDDET